MPPRRTPLPTRPSPGNPTAQDVVTSGNPTGESPFATHRRQWADCRRCPLHEHRRSVCLFRGEIPARVLFVGEAPGFGEDTLGVPFVGPAGKMLDRIFASACRKLGRTPTAAFANLLACIPTDADRQKVSEPPEGSVRACAPRLGEFVYLCEPRLVVCVGKEAKDYLEPGLKKSVPLPKSCPTCRRPCRRGEEGYTCKGGHKYSKKEKLPDIPQTHIVHPAFVLRSPEGLRDLLVRRSIADIADAMEEHL